MPSSPAAAPSAAASTASRSSSIGRPTVPGSAWPGEHEGAAGGAAHELLHEPGLADARLARHQGDRRDGARADECGQAVELDRPAHHHGRQTGPAHEHTVMVRPAGRIMIGWGMAG